MKPVIQIMPLALLFAGAAVGVWKGFGNTSDKARKAEPGDWVKFRRDR